MSPRASIAKWVSKESIQVRQIWCHADGHFHRGFGSLPRYIPIFRRGRPRIKLVTVAWFASMPGPLGESRVVTLNQGSENCPKSGPKAHEKNSYFGRNISKKSHSLSFVWNEGKIFGNHSTKGSLQCQAILLLEPCALPEKPIIAQLLDNLTQENQRVPSMLSTSFPWWMMIRLTSTDGQSQNTCTTCCYAMGYLILQLLCQINFQLKVLWKFPSDSWRNLSGTPEPWWALCFFNPEKKIWHVNVLIIWLMVDSYELWVQLCLCTVSWSVLVACKILVSFLLVKSQMIAEYSREIKASDGTMCL